MNKEELIKLYEKQLELENYFINRISAFQQQSKDQFIALRKKLEELKGENYKQSKQTSYL